MFKFLFGKTGTKAVKETQRQTIVRALDEVNGILAGMSDKPSIAVDLNTGLISVDLPEQMPDEALALPAPQAEPDAAPDKAVDDADKAVPRRTQWPKSPPPEAAGQNEAGQTEKRATPRGRPLSIQSLYRPSVKTHALKRRYLMRVRG